MNEFLYICISICKIIYILYVYIGSSDLHTILTSQYYTNMRPFPLGRISEKCSIYRVENALYEMHQI